MTLEEIIQRAVEEASGRGLELAGRGTVTRRRMWLPWQVGYVVEVALKESGWVARCCVNKKGVVTHVVSQLSEDGAVQIARAHAQAKGWPFREPLHVVARGGRNGETRSFEIWTNHPNLGSKAHFVVDGCTGEIMHAGYVSR